MSARRALITEAGIPASVNAVIVSNARLKLPFCLKASCTSSGPSTDTATDSIRTRFKVSIISGVIRKPFVMMQHFTPREVSASTIEAQSLRMNTSPPIIETRLQPISASCAATPSHSSSVSSFSRAFPPHEPQ